MTSVGGTCANCLPSLYLGLEVTCLPVGIPIPNKVCVVRTLCRGGREPQYSAVLRQFTSRNPLCFWVRKQAVHSLRIISGFMRLAYSLTPVQCKYFCDSHSEIRRGMRPVSHSFFSYHLSLSLSLSIFLYLSLLSVSLSLSVSLFFVWWRSTNE